MPKGKPKAGHKTSGAKTYREIADLLGFRDTGSVIHIEQRALRKMRAEAERLGWTP